MYHALITYDGTNYFGWQKTKSGPSIQEEIEIALQKITGQKTQPEAASRTDRGVHAIGQVVQFACQTHLALDDLKRALNAVLPQDIRVLELSLKDFHPTLDSIGKEYIYKFSPVPVQDPTIRLYSWHLRYPIDFAPMKKAAAHLVGSHDFTSFANNKEKDPNCKIEDISIYPDYISIKGDRFLYKMVRNLVGTLIYVGYGKIHPSDIPRILAAKDRKLAGITAPAHGLYLHQVFYLIN
jgi:tRNA pseudouridine38-40 synthase